MRRFRDRRGRVFIRWSLAHEIASLMKYRGLSVKRAADDVINKTLRAVKGAEGGVIALDAKGNFAMPFNSEGMYRGWIGPDGEPHVAIYRD